MLSRVANAIYWSARYLERAENVSRILYVTLHYDMESTASSLDNWTSLVRASGDEKFFREKYTSFTRDNVLKFLVTDKSNFNSIHCCISAARENARTIREVISQKMWEDINQLYWSAHEFSKKRNPAKNLEDYLTNLQDRYMSFMGATEATMNHDEAWHFARLGRMIERGDKTGRILDVNYFVLGQSNGEGSPGENYLMAKALLKSASAFDMYRRKNTDISPEKVCYFLLSDADFPRSILYCAQQVSNSIKAICRYNQNSFSEGIRSKASDLFSFVEDRDSVEPTSQSIHQFVDDFQTRVNALDTHIYKIFFSSPTEVSVASQSQTVESR